MLTKLIKHEFRATGRIMLPLYLVLLATAAGANFATRRMGDLGVLLVLIFALMILAVCVVSVVLMVQRFRQNLLGDEGYLMLTLPVSIHQHLWAKMMVSAAWFAASLLAMLAALLLLVWRPGNLEQLSFAAQNVPLHLNDLRELQTLMLELLVLGFVACCTFCLQFYAAMAAGYSFSSHKAAWSVLFFFLFGTATSILTSFLEFDIEFERSGLAQVHQAMWIIIAGTAAVGAIHYLITAWFLKRRLNLA